MERIEDGKAGGQRSQTLYQHHCTFLSFQKLFSFPSVSPDLKGTSGRFFRSEHMCEHMKVPYIESLLFLQRLPNAWILAILMVPDLFSCFILRVQVIIMSYPPLFLDFYIYHTFSSVETPKAAIRHHGAFLFF